MPSAFADHIVLFGRVLRRAGLAVGAGEIADALRAVDLVGVARRDDVYQALFSVFVTRRVDVPLFDEAFRRYWRAPAEAPASGIPAPSPVQPKPDGSLRVRQALAERAARPPEAPPARTEEAREVALTYSPAEALRTKDFADFTAEEEQAAKKLLRALRWPIEPQTTRRRARRERGRRLDLRGTMRALLRHGGEPARLRYQGHKKKPRSIVVLCDVSGSMERYARLLLHFMHAVTGGMHGVESFVFGTRLTRITRHLRRRDVDVAVTAVAHAVNDWSGGTRIGEALRTFNYVWLRRVLTSRGVVLLISDGWDRGDPTLLAREMRRLSASCHRLIWLNPLLGYAGYRPLTRGIRAALPYVDDFLPVHNLDSLARLGALLSTLSRRPGRSGRRSLPQP